MTGRTSRSKGARGETEVVTILEEHGFCDVHRTPHSGALEWLPGDVCGTPWHHEVKRCEAWRPAEWYAKAKEQAAGKIALVWMRRNRGPWLVLVSAEDLFRLLEEYGEREGRGHEQE